MSDHENRWTLVGAAIDARITALGLSKAEVIRRSGVSAKTLDRYIAGEPIVRPDKRRGLSRALGWSLDSIDLLLEGGTPRPLPDEPDALGFQIDTEATASRLQKRANRHRAEIERLKRRVSQLERLMDRRFDQLLEAMGLEWDDLTDGDDPAAVTKGPGSTLDELDEMIDELEGRVSPERPGAAGPPEPDGRSADR